VLHALDAEKYGHTRTVQFASPNHNDMLISDRLLAEVAGKELEKLAKEVFLG